MPCSIVIPSKDRPTGLIAAVRSALMALPEGGEIVVVDDGSQIPASVVLAPFATPALRVVENPGLQGPSGARNHGVAMSRHPVIFFLDDDDTLVPDYCQDILDRIDDLPGSVGYGFSAALIKAPAGPDTFQGKAIDSGILQDDTPLDQRLTGLGTGFWIKRTVFLAVGGLDTDLRVNEDTEFSIRLAAAGIRPYYHNTPGVVIFQDPVRDAKDRKSITRSIDALARARGFEHILHKHDNFLKDHGDFRRKFMLRIIKFRSRARMIDGWTEFCRSLRPSMENRMIWANGLLWLKLSVALRRLKG